MLFELLEHALRIEARVGIVESGHEAQRNDVVLAAVDPGPAVFFRCQRPAHGVDHLAWGNAARWNLPEFLHALAVGLRVTFHVKPEARNKLPGERAARAFSEDDDFGVELVAGLEVGLGLVLFVHALVVGANSRDARAVEKQLRTSEAREDSDPGLFDFTGQPR